jgi:hypothetical protein
MTWIRVIHLMITTGISQKAGPASVQPPTDP